jgi:phospholipid/cholesterol/gamma-HCH transport system substrate-binding protein
MRAIRAHVVDAVAIVALVAVAGVVAVLILANQGSSLPGWVPIVGHDVTEIEAELSSAQAVTPGQGQTVNVAGVEVGEISAVRLERGRAIVTLQLDGQDVPVYKDASVLLRPRTGLRDMVAELTPGTRAAGRLEPGKRIPIGQTLPDVNLDEILASLDADTRDYLRVLLRDASTALDDNGSELGQAIRRFEPTAKYTRKVNEQLAVRRRNIKRVVHNFSLLMGELGAKDRQVAAFVQNSNAVFATLASQDANLRATLRELPSTLTATRTALGKAEVLADELGPTLQALRPGARALGPTLRQTRPFLRETTPVIRDEIRPFVRASRPLVTELRPAMRDLSALTPKLLRSFKVVNALLNTLAYNPPGDTEEGFLFWASWVNHLGPAVFSNQDAHGPIRRGLVVVGCQSLQVLENIVLGNPQLGVLTQLLEAPDRADVCPTSAQQPGAGGAG